jgi:hypothetical protein
MHSVVVHTPYIWKKKKWSVVNISIDFEKSSVRITSGDIYIYKTLNEVKINCKLKLRLFFFCESILILILNQF